MNRSRIAGRIILPAVACGLVALFGACSSPFSEFQSARMAGPGEIEFSGHYSKVGISGGFYQDQLGAQLGVGVTNSFDIRARYESVLFEDQSIGVFGFGPKFSMYENQAAVYLPVGFAFGEGIKTDRSWEVHPTILTTHAVSPRFEINVSMKALLSLNYDDGYNTRLAINVGLGIGPEDLSYMFRPEAGVMVHHSGGDPFYHLGLGMSFSTTGKRRVRTPAIDG